MHYSAQAFYWGDKMCGLPFTVIKRETLLTVCFGREERNKTYMLVFMADWSGMMNVAQLPLLKSKRIPTAAHCWLWFKLRHGSNSFVFFIYMFFKGQQKVKKIIYFNTAKFSFFLMAMWSLLANKATVSMMWTVQSVWTFEQWNKNLI